MASGFNPHITATEFAAMTDFQKREWNRRLLDFWSIDRSLQDDLDYRHDEPKTGSYRNWEWGV